MLPAVWVDELFAKLTVRYGAEFSRRYADVDPALVKSDWAEVLSGFTRDALDYGLQFLPAKPPNASEFRELCRHGPRQAPPALDGPPADPERVAAARARLAEVRQRIAGRPKDGKFDAWLAGLPEGDDAA